MEIKVLCEDGFYMALFGLGLSYGLTSGCDFENFPEEGNSQHAALFDIANKLAHKGNGENKFLRQIQIWLDITAPLYWWKEFDTYKVGTTAQSESTMHTILKHKITEKNFAPGIYDIDTLCVLQEAAKESKDAWHDLIAALPSGWLQRRIVNLNYAVLQNIYAARKDHKLPEWRTFCRKILISCLRPCFIKRCDD